MALGAIKLTALQTTALVTVYKDGHSHNISARECKALEQKGVIEFSGMKHIVNADGIQCLIEAGVINPQPAVVEAAPELSETETIALMLIKDGVGDAVDTMTSEVIDWNSMLERGWLMRHSSKKPECLIISEIASIMLREMGM